MLDFRVSFDNLEEVRAAVDPVVYQKAVGSTIKKLSDQVATRISKAVRARYPVPAVQVRKALRMVFRDGGDLPERVLIYTAARISLRHFAFKAKPKVETARGIRRGAKYRKGKRKDGEEKTHKHGFWGRSRAGDIDGANVEQIFVRADQSNSASKLGKVTGPSVSQMVRGTVVLDEVNKFIEENRDRILSQNIDHFLQKHRGTR